MFPRPTVALYARVSTDQQKTDSQRDVLKTYGKAQGWSSLDYAWYADSETGRTTDRPQLQRLLRDVEGGRVKVVVFTRLDRLSRSTMEGLRLLSQFADKGIRVVSVLQGIDFNGTYGKFLASLFLSLAELEADTIRARVNEGLAAARARGVRLGRKPDMQKRAEIKRLRESGLGVTAIAARLNVKRQSVYRMM